MPETKCFSAQHLSACVLIVAVIGLIFTAAPNVGATTPITLDSVSTKGNDLAGAVSTLSWSHTVASGASVLIVGVSEASVPIPPTVVSVTFGSSSLTLIGREDAGTPGGSSSHVELWCLHNPPAGTATVTFTLSDAETAVFGGAVSFFNVVEMRSFTGSNDQSRTVTAPSITVPAVAGELVVGVLATCAESCVNSATAPTPGAGSTVAYISTEINRELFAAASYAPAASPVTLSWVYTSTDWAMGGVALMPPELVPEYPLGLPLLAIFMIFAYGLIKHRTRNTKNI